MVSEWECVECGDDIWVCQEKDDMNDGPDCNDLPPGNMMAAQSQEPCPGGWCYVGCELYNAEAEYSIWFKAGSQGGKCQVVIRPKDDGSPGSGWLYVETRELGPGRFKIWCKRGGGGDPRKVVLKAVMKC